MRPNLHSSFLPTDASGALLVGRVWRAGSINGPCVVVLRAGQVVDITASAPTLSDLLERHDLLEFVRDCPGEPLGEVAGWLDKAPDVRVMIAANFSVGAVLMMRFAAQAAGFFESAEIIEQHLLVRHQSRQPDRVHVHTLLERAPGPLGGGRRGVRDLAQAGRGPGRTDQVRGPGRGP